MDKSAIDWGGPGKFLAGLGSGVGKAVGGGIGHAVGRSMMLPALYGGGALAAGIGIPYGTLKLLQYLGDKGHTNELEQRLLLQQQRQLAASQYPHIKTSSDQGIGLVGLEKTAFLNRLFKKKVLTRGEDWSGHNWVVNPYTKKVVTNPTGIHDYAGGKSYGKTIGKVLGAGAALGLGGYGAYHLLKDPKENVPYNNQSIYY